MVTERSGFTRMSECRWSEGVCFTRSRFYILQYIENTLKLIERTPSILIIQFLRGSQKDAKKKTPQKQPKTN